MSITGFSTRTYHLDGCGMITLLIDFCSFGQDLSSMLLCDCVNNRKRASIVSLDTLSRGSRAFSKPKKRVACKTTGPNRNCGDCNCGSASHQSLCDQLTTGWEPQNEYKLIVSFQARCPNFKIFIASKSPTHPLRSLTHKSLYCS